MRGNGNGREGIRQLTWVGDAGDGRSSPFVVATLGARQCPWVVGTWDPLLFAAAAAAGGWRSLSLVEGGNGGLLS